MEKRSDHRVVCFGEVLWDIFSSGAVPGGAPMNVTYHLHKHGKNPALITRVGKDEKGYRLKEIFSTFGVCTDYFQEDAQYETGKVYAQPNEQNEVIYDIVKPVAWDYIAWKEDYPTMISRADYFVFGTLAARNKETRNTLLQLLEAANTKVLDINLRPPFAERGTVQELLDWSDFLKLNNHELDLVAGWFGAYRTTEDKIKALAEKFSLSNIVVTMGGEGAVLYQDGNMYVHPGFKVMVQDTVGSGDSFLAGLLSKLMEQESPQDALEYANSLGAFIATQRGACPYYEIQDVLTIIKGKSAEKPK